MKEKNSDITTMQVERETLQLLRLVASLEGQTVHQWLAWATKRAYEAAIINKGRKISTAKEDAKTH